LVAGIRKSTLIVNFPGSEKACRECYEVIAEVLNHAVDQLRQDSEKVAIVHQKLHISSNAIMKSRVNLTPSGHRLRNSPFEMISFDEAMRIVNDESVALRKVIKLSLNEISKLIGKVVAEDITSPMPLPPFRASIKDGYAVIAKDGSGNRKVIDIPIVAGIDPDKVSVKEGFCARINTGGPVPENADAVVQVEDTEVVETAENGEEIIVNIKKPPSIDQDIRAIGSDIKTGEVVISKGTKLGPVELGILATVGCKSVPVFQRAVVAIMSTGDELLSAGDTYKKGAIYDANRVTLMALLTKHNYEVVDMGIARDDTDDVCNKIASALHQADVLITTGGVSMGEKDIVKAVLMLDFEAKIHFGRVNMKPGKPTTFATCCFENQKKLIFALPGNPVSAFVTCLLFAMPSLQILSGDIRKDHTKESNQLQKYHKTMKVNLKISKPLELDERPHFMRAVIDYSGDQIVATVLSGSQRSSRLLSAKDADALVLIPSKKEIKKDFLTTETAVTAFLISA
ncbi:gephyrin-like protein, partial [Dinothrombium tinctorium]